MDSGRVSVNVDVIGDRGVHEIASPDSMDSGRVRINSDAMGDCEV